LIPRLTLPPSQGSPIHPAQNDKRVAPRHSLVFSCADHDEGSIKDQPLATDPKRLLGLLFTRGMHDTASLQPNSTRLTSFSGTASKISSPKVTKLDRSTKQSPQFSVTISSSWRSGKVGGSSLSIKRSITPKGTRASRVVFCDLIVAKVWLDINDRDSSPIAGAYINPQLSNRACGVRSVERNVLVSSQDVLVSSRVFPALLPGSLDYCALVADRINFQFLLNGVQRNNRKHRSPSC
jgi:hypothetical protein